MSEAVKLHVKKGDTVLVLSGKDKGKKGKIIEALPKKGKVVVEGVNKVKRHTKPTQKMPQGGIIVKEAAMHSSKLMLACPSCDKPTPTRCINQCGMVYATPNRLRNNYDCTTELRWPACLR